MRDARITIMGTQDGARTWGVYQHYGNPHFASSLRVLELGRAPLNATPDAFASQRTTQSGSEASRDQELRHGDQDEGAEWQPERPEQDVEGANRDGRSGCDEVADEERHRGDSARRGRRAREVRHEHEAEGEAAAQTRPRMTVATPVLHGTDCPYRSKPKEREGPDDEHTQRSEPNAL